MEAVLIILLFYISFYLWSVARLAWGMGKIQMFETADLVPKTTFTVVVPFRNEGKNLPALLQSLANLEYPRTLFEVILIDDGSNDEGQSLVYQWRMQNGSLYATLLENIRRTGSPKKDAISRAIPIATGNWIITTDADCEIPKTWLTAFDQFIRKGGKRMVAGPVIYKRTGGLAGVFQQHDLLAMQGATIGGFGLGKPFICNGANFAYEKDLFTELGGFTGNTNQPGGDDVFLLHKAAAASVAVGYLKSRKAIVRTQSQKNWLNLINQRVRWASKTSSYQSEFAEDIALAVLFGNASLVVLGVLAGFQKVGWEFFAIPFLLKFLLDWRVMYSCNQFLRQDRWVIPIISAVIYPLFTIAVAILSVRGRYSWKGRKWAGKIEV